MPSRLVARSRARSPGSLLLEFTGEPGRVLSRGRLLEQVWDYPASSDTRVVDVHVQRLRMKVGKERIETVRGFGYKLVG